jgi:hypothetical protein
MRAYAGEANGGLAGSRERATAILFGRVSRHLRLRGPDSLHKQTAASTKVQIEHCHQYAFAARASSPGILLLLLRSHIETPPSSRSCSRLTRPQPALDQSGNTRSDDCSSFYFVVSFCTGQASFD